MKRTLALLAAAQLADILTTWYGLNHGAREGNPGTLAAVAFGGWAMFAFIKLGTVPVVGLLSYLTPTEKVRRHVHTAIRFVAAMIFGVATVNVLVTW